MPTSTVFAAVPGPAMLTSRIFWPSLSIGRPDSGVNDGSRDTARPAYSAASRACTVSEMAKAIERAWEAALDELGAGDSDIERGLRIHRDAIVCDPVSGGARPWSPAMSALARELIRDGTAPQDMELQLQEVADRDVVADAGVRSEYLEAWRRSGVTLANDYGHMFCSWRTEGFGGLTGDLIITLRSVARTTAVLDALRDHLIKFRLADDVVAAKRAGKHCIMWSTGGPPPWIEHDLDNLEIYHRLGFRQAQILYYTNRLGTQCYDRRDHGLTDAGVDYVRRLNRLGIVVDLAHCSRCAHLDAAAASTAPVIDSHTGCTAVRDHPRNLDDETIRAIAGTGGVVSILGGPGRRFLAEPLGGLADWLRHVEHVAEVAGIKHVGGRGSDVSYRGSIPHDIRPHLFAEAPEPMDGQLDGSFAWVAAPYFTVALATRGYTDEEIAAIVGGNYLRVLREVCG